MSYSKEHTQISIIIPCWNEERTVYHCIKAISTIASEVIICDDNSDDNSIDRIIQANYEFRTPMTLLLANLRNNPAVRNSMIPCATGDIIVSIDADCCFIAAKASEFLAELKNIKPGEFRRFKVINISKDLYHACDGIFSPPDVGLSAFRPGSAPDMEFYADKDGFAKFRAPILTYSKGVYAFHFKYNKSQDRLNKRKVYREHIRTGIDIDELCKSKYGNQNKVINKMNEPALPIPDEYLKYKIYQEVVEYVNGLRDL